MISLNELITDATPVITLKNDSHISSTEKEKVLGNIRASLSKKEQYLKMMYFMNGYWYYFKKEGENDGYPMCLFDELMGKYLSKSISLNALDLIIAKNKKGIGLASKNFKDDNYTYYFGDYFHKIGEQQYKIHFGLDISNIDYLSILCPTTDNALKLVDDFQRLLAVDTYMLQTDRSAANIQFAVNNQTQETNLATIYDFSNCLKAVSGGGLFLKNRIVTIDELCIPKMAKEYPDYIAYLSFLIEQGFLPIWDKICDDYYFNKDTESYEQVKSYYQTKEETHNKYLNELIKRYR